MGNGRARVRGAAVRGVRAGDPGTLGSVSAGSDGEGWRGCRPVPTGRPCLGSGVASYPRSLHAVAALEVADADPVTPTSFDMEQAPKTMARETTSPAAAFPLCAPGSPTPLPSCLDIGASTRLNPSENRREETESRSAVQLKSDAFPCSRRPAPRAAPPSSRQRVSGVLYFMRQSDGDA